MMFRKIRIKHYTTLSIAQKIHDEAIEKVRVSKNNLRNLRKEILKETEKTILKNEQRYRWLCKMGKYLTHPKTLRSLELRIIFQRLEYQAQMQGKSRHEFDFNKFLHLLRITSDID